MGDLISFPQERNEISITMPLPEFATIVVSRDDQYAFVDVPRDLLEDETTAALAITEALDLCDRHINNTRGHPR